ncbi:helix-turn-helix domain-containing protein [Dactylosporangium sp. AC04546]|uniref:helix-turn-helix domain-containing protein n=1 Tax=Dactylosporangium sp. AC04546 TaxID=2862460 RepID=UPI001EE0C20B|nr:helix-turn-helix domain-containing protein [Dactylosporangium sp. AC04546]WVK81211.1 helix-turn-helix domain-containing protein [Dactylosporangium sp. AC04546]
MTTVWKAAEAPARERAAAVREAVGSRVVRVDIALPDDPGDIDVELTLSDAGPVQVLTVRSMATTVTRSPRLARDEAEPQLFLTLQGTGESAMAQHGRHARLRGGQFAVYTTTNPYTLMFDHGLDAHFFRIPVAELALPEPALREVSARALGPGNPVAELTAGYLRRIADSPDLRSRAVAGSLAQPTIDLVRAALLSSMADPALGKASMESTLEVRLLEYLHTHLGDHGLTAARIAAAHHISVRHLYAVLSRAGVSLGDWLRTHRLEACRRELAKPRSRTRTIASVAHQWGFADATHFSRAFRATYGMTPRDWRNAKSR